MNIFRVIIAEDEPIVGRFIKQIVSTVNGVDIISVCKSGEEVLTKINTTLPDILITDIHMHGMSGLNLIAKVKSVKPDIQVIIISGYSLFEYAKEAIKLGVEDYLLKPINPEELINGVSKIRDKLIHLNNEKKNQLLKRLLYSKEYERIGDLFDSQAVEIMIVNQSGDPENVVELCCHAINDVGDNEVCSALWNRSVILIRPYVNNSNSFIEIKNWLKIHSEVKTMELLYTDSPFCCCDFPTVLPNMYCVSREERILGKITEHIYTHEIALTRIQRRTQNKFPSSVLSGKKRVIQQSYFNLFAEWELKEFTVRELRSTLFALLENYNRIYSLADELPSADEQIAECIKYADSFSQARDDTWAIIEPLIVNKKSFKGDSHIDLSGLFNEIDIFLRNNCSNNYSLQDIAQRFHVSQPYISKAFRTNAGMTYKEYCINQKIELAKQLIATHSNLMIKDIALQVGIAPAYFGVVFYRVTGIYPSEYKAEQENYNK